jgi:hypothetical protein
MNVGCFRYKERRESRVDLFLLAAIQREGEVMATTQEIFDQYRALRRTGQSAGGALRTLRSGEKTQQTLPWQPSKGRDEVKKVRVEREGFTCWLTIQYDYDYNFGEFRGKFTDTYEEHALENPNHRLERNTYRYFIPEITVAEHRKGLSELGMARSEAEEQARKYVREDMLIALDPSAQGYAAYGVMALVMLEGVELAESSCWGIEIGELRYDHDPYLEECALEELEAALREAKEKLLKLQSHR